jgi:hypothetical protein
MGRLIVFYVVPLVLAIYCLVNAITSRADDVRNLPKVAWILLILFFPFLGSIAWLVAGRPVAARPRRYERSAPEFPEYDRPGRAAAMDPEADAEFLRKVRERAEEQRRKAKEQAKETGSEPGAEPTEDETS